MVPPTAVLNTNDFNATVPPATKSDKAVNPAPITPKP